MSKMPVIAIVGPTATGKTALALEVAEAFGGEIVNADALQVYQGLDLGTAKPTPEERQRIRHHLVDFLPPSERFSAGDFARLATAAIDEIQSRGRIALVVGGSGLYLKALFDGLGPMPPSSLETKETLRQRLATEGREVLRRELESVDPETYQRIAAGDTQRLLRALEVHMLSGRSLSAWIAEEPFGSRPIYAERVGLTLPRSILYDRISSRVARMVKGGWVCEVERLLRDGITSEMPAFQAIGYRSMARHVEGRCTLAEAVDDTVRSTRRFAKRQLTWFRKEQRISWFDVQDPDSGTRSILEHIKLRGLGGPYG